ncbi:MAG: hypothetical protein JSU68_05390, partial [Phycisphaerales bacterium]
MAQCCYYVNPGSVRIRRRQRLLLTACNVAAYVSLLGQPSLTPGSYSLRQGLYCAAAAGLLIYSFCLGVEVLSDVIFARM